MSAFIDITIVGKYNDRNVKIDKGYDSLRTRAYVAGTRRSSFWLKADDWRSAPESRTLQYRWRYYMTYHQ